MNQSDIDDVLFLGGFERFLPGRRAQFRDGPAWEWIYGPSFIARHVVHDLLDYDRGFIKRSTLDTVRAESVQRLDEAVDAFRELSRRHGFDLLVVVHPTQEEVDGGLLELKPLVEHLRAQGIAVVDIHAFFQGKDGIPDGRSTEFFWPVDGHNTARGYELLVSGVARSTRFLELLPPPGS